MKSSLRFHEPPKPPIGEVIKELTGQEMPTGFGWVRTVCPFCNDRNGSASVNHDVGGFRCHQCDRSGDALKLLQDELRLTFKEACDKAEQLGGSVDRPKTKRRASDLLRGMQ